MVSLASFAVFFIIIQVYYGTCLNIPKKEKRGLDGFVNEFSYLLQNSSEMKEASDEDSSSGIFLVKLEDDSALSEEIFHSDNERLISEFSGGYNSIPSESSEQNDSSEKGHYMLPFTIDEGISLSSIRNQSKDCILDRKHITLMFQECFYNQTSLPTLDDKNVAISEPNLRDYNAHFLKYCRRAPELRICVKNFIVRTKEHCMDEGDHETIGNVEQVTEHIIKFICHKEADRIAIFIADGGLECLLSKHYRMYACLVFNLGNYALVSIAELAALELNELKCATLRGAERCITQELELCEHQVSAIATGVLFNVVKEIASCEDSTEEVGSESRDEGHITNVRSQDERKGSTVSATPPTSRPIVNNAFVNDGQANPDTDQLSTSNATVESSSFIDGENHHDSEQITTTTTIENVGQAHPDPDQLLASSATVESASVTDGENQQDSDQMTTTIENVGQAHPDTDQLSTSSPTVESASVTDGENQQDSDQMTTTIVNVGQAHPDTDQLSTSSPTVESASVTDGQNQQDNEQISTTIVNVGQAHPDTDQLSTSSPTVESASVTDGQNQQDNEQISTTIPDVTPGPSQYHVSNTTIAAYESSATAAGILCALLIFYIIIIILYKLTVNKIK